MKIALRILGILIIGILFFPLIVTFYSLLSGNINDNVIKIFLISIIGVIIGILLIYYSLNKTQNFNKFDMQEFEAFKQYQEQQRRIYYRNANAQGKPLSEYLMDDRTKLVTYYDRMPTSYKDKLVNYADKLYRDFENEEYLNRK